jgi:osmotically-inducible protein OsmY
MKLDSEVRRDVESELSREPSIDTRDIGVAVKDGIVTLTGHVSSYWNKVAAERAAKRVAGVTGLADGIEITVPMGGSGRIETSRNRR